MPTALVVGQIYAHTTYLTEPGQVSICTRHWEAGAVAGVGPLPSLEDMNATFDAALAAVFKPVLNNTATYYGSQSRRVSGAAPFEVPAATTLNQGPGTSGAIAAPKQVSGLIAFYSNFRGIAGSGRTYVAFPATADVQGTGEPTPAYIADLYTLGNLLGGQINVTLGLVTVTMDPVTWDQVTATSRAIETIIVRSAFATQKRRGDYGKLNALPF